jgi:hypothetical protein
MEQRWTSRAADRSMSIKYEKKEGKRKSLGRKSPKLQFKSLSHANGEHI